MAKTMLFNPYTGKPRDPRDIASDPAGILMLDPDEPIYATSQQREPQEAASMPQAEPTDEEIIGLARTASTVNNYANGRFVSAIFERDHTIRFARAVLALAGSAKQAAALERMARLDDEIGDAP